MYMVVRSYVSKTKFFRKVTEAYTVLGKNKTRRKYDQYEQLHFAIITGLRDQRTGQAPSSSPRLLDLTFWDPIKSGSSTLYCPPAGYWTVMNKIVPRERSKAEATSSSPQTVMPSHDRPEDKS
ncbi:hypothetical protein BDR04DRAFT_1232062 [Suillus decipiens]|nr:hypothetical protein BDR04DRAFT_1232062 [Suillus decipiens]